MEFHDMYMAIIQFLLFSQILLKFGCIILHKFLNWYAML
jgi:hypothetical protein